eukprot:c56000_g1_i1 orf=35-253(-)
MKSQQMGGNRISRVSNLWSLMRLFFLTFDQKDAMKKALMVGLWHMDNIPSVLPLLGDTSFNQEIFDKTRCPG